MLIVLVDVRVRPEAVDAFKRETTKNAQLSLSEPGIARFDVLEQHGDRTRFLLVEVYRDDDAPARHKQTPHYLAWRDAVEPMMAAPRTSTKYHGVFPGALGWDAQQKDA